MLPRIIHIIWIGDESKRPDGCIETWRTMNPGFEVKVWGNHELTTQAWRLADQMQKQPEINGIADMMRWEILFDHGGIAVDADSECVRAIPDWMLEADSLACWENEIKRPGLIACGFLGCEAGNELIGQVITDIYNRDMVSGMAWETVGPGAITRTHRAIMYDKLTILPSHFFIPRHFSNQHAYEGSLVFARQHWGSTFQSYTDGLLS